MIILQAATHNGVFHADDVFAGGLLIATLRDRGTYRDVQITRTRDPKVLTNANVVFDVGGEHDPGIRRFDHHQRAFVKSRGNGVKYSSFGLLFLEYGRMLTGGIPNELINEFIREVDRVLVEPIDALDNGQIPQEPSLGSWVQWMNVGDLDGQYEQAVEIAYHIIYWTCTAIKARIIARAAVVKEVDTQAGQDIIILPSGTPGWQEIVCNLSPGTAFVIFPDITSGWRVQAVPVTPGSFKCSHLLPDAWRGLRDKELREKCGVSDATFTHAAGFIGGAGSQAGVMALARLSLQ